MQVLYIWGPKILQSDKGAWRNKLSIAKKHLASAEPVIPSVPHPLKVISNNVAQKFTSLHWSFDIV